jgi:hypothetical protein
MMTLLAYRNSSVYGQHLARASDAFPVEELSPILRSEGV